MKNGKKLSQLSLMDEKSYSGRIVTHYGNQLEVEVLNGPLEGTTQRCHQRSSMTTLVTGDLITWKPDSTNTGIVMSQADRCNVFGRYDSEGRFKPLASNLDCVLVVIAATPKAYLLSLIHISEPTRPY